MKAIFLTLALIGLIEIIFIQAGISSDDLKRGQKVLEELEAHPFEYHTAYQNLGEEDKKLLIEAARRKNTDRERRFEKAQKRRFEISAQGSAQLDFQIGYYYRAVGESASMSIEDPEARKQFDEQMKKELLELRKRINENDGPENIIIWRKYKPIMESMAKQYPWKFVDQESLRVIASKLLNPLMSDLQKAIAAESEKDKPWYLREKWKSTYGDEESNVLPQPGMENPLR